MLKTLIALAATLLSLVAAPPAAAGTEHIHFELEGHARVARLFVPEGLAGPAPLVVALHGIIENGNGMQSQVTRGHLDTLAAQYGFVVVYPSALLGFWNIGIGEGAAQIVPRRDDHAYLKQVLAEVSARVEIDRRRIFAAGFSQGGLQALSLACQNPGLLRAVAIISMSVPDILRAKCARHPPEGVLFAAGTDDVVVPFEGGEVPSGPKKMMTLLGQEDSVELLRAAKGCYGAPEERVWDGRDATTRVTRQAWHRCAHGALEAYRIEGGGHRWPSGGPSLPLVGITTKEINGAAAVWGFFSRFQ